VRESEFINQEKVLHEKFVCGKIAHYCYGIGGTSELSFVMGNFLYPRTTLSLKL
jgi:hypothetical protein